MYYDEEDDFGLDLPDEEDDGARRKPGTSSISLPKPSRAVAAVMEKPASGPNEDFAATQFEADSDFGPKPSTEDRTRGAQTGVRAAYDRLKQVEGERPETPNPKWWQRLLAGAAAGAVGYANAGGRIRPVDPSGIANLIMAPNHPRDMAEWQRKKDAAKVDVTAAEREAALAHQEEADETNRELRKAQAEMYRRHGEAYDAQKDRPVKVGPHTYWDPKARTTFDVATDAKPIEYKPGYGYEDPQNPGKVDVKVPAQPKAERKPTENLDYVLLHPDEFAPEVVQRAKEMDARRHPGRQGGGDKPASPAQFRYIEAKKQERLLKAEREAKKRITGDPAKQIEPEDPNVVATDLQEAKQQIQDAYEAEITAAGGQATHFEYGNEPQGGKPKTPKPAAPKGKPAPASTPGASPVPKNVADSVPEGGYATSPDGKRFQKKNGVMVQVGG